MTLLAFKTLFADLGGVLKKNFTDDKVRFAYE